MITMCRDDFVSMLKDGSPFIIGTTTCNSGLLTNSGSTNRKYMRTENHKQTLKSSVTNAIVNRLRGSSSVTDINPYIPNFSSGSDCMEKVPLKKIPWESMLINEDYIEIKEGQRKIIRAMAATSYVTDAPFRTSYYFGGNVDISGQNFLYIAECIELPEVFTFRSVPRYVPSIFVLYGVKTDRPVKMPSHAMPLGAKVDEILRDAEMEEDQKRKSTKVKRKKVSK